MPRIYRLIPAEGRFWQKVRKTRECWLWTARPGGHGYGRISLGGTHGGMMLAHRFSYELHYGPIPDGLCVLHSCDVRLCVNPDHLFLGTRDDNMADMVKKRRQRQGHRVPGAKLNSDQIAAIRQDQRKQRDIAADYGISQSNVSFIKRGATWAHVK